MASVDKGVYKSVLKVYNKFDKYVIKVYNKIEVKTYVS